MSAQSGPKKANLRDDLTSPDIAPKEPPTFFFFIFSLKIKQEEDLDFTFQLEKEKMYPKKLLTTFLLNIRELYRVPVWWSENMIHVLEAQVPVH